MRIEELRIGNWVRTCTPDMPIMIPHIDAQVQGITIFHEVQFCYSPLNNNGFKMPTKHIMGIPITPEWLEKFGFKKDSYDYCWYGQIKFYPIYQRSIYFGFNGLGLSVKEFQYIHQLQNIYFALRHEELTIKKETAV